MHFTRNCDCMQASFGSDSRVLLAETILTEAGIWCRLAPGDTCGMVLVVRSDDSEAVSALLREKGFKPDRMIHAC